MQSSSTTHRLEVTAGRTLVARVWPGEGLPVVFLHGLFSSSEERVELVGHSYGGAVAARVAELMPERVVSLLLLAPAGFGALGTVVRPGPRAYDGAVTALWGTRDRIVRPSHSRGVTRAYPAAQNLLFDGMGHHPQAEHSGALVELIATGRVAHGCRRARRSARRRFFPSSQPRMRVRFA